MGFTVDPKDVMPETDQEEKAWLMLYGMIECYRERGMVLKATPTNLRFCHLAVRIADLEKEAPADKGRG